MEFNREGYYTEHYDNDKEPYHNGDYNIESNIVFFGIFILCILAAFCSGGCGRWWDAELNVSLIDDEVIIDIKKNIKKYEHINKDITELCVICLEEYSIEDNILILDCNHYYHSECLINWFKKNPLYTCPLCRSETI